MGSPIEVKSPLKGVMKNPSFQDFPVDAAVDALNVRPFDVGGRMRVAQRPGLDKLFPAALTASSYVQAMIQATVALDPATVTTVGSPLFDDVFNYANGALNTVSSGVWSAGQQLVGSNNFSGAQTPNVVSAAVSTQNTSANGFASFKTVDVAMGSTYVIGLRITPESPSVSNDYFGIAFQMQPGSESTTGWMVWLQSSGSDQTSAVITQANGGTGVIRASGSAISLTHGVSHLLEARVTPSTISIFIDNVSTGVTFANTDTGFRRVGFFVRGAGNPTLVTEFKVSGGQAPATLRQTYVAYACGGNLFAGTNATQPAATGGTGSGALSTTAIPSFAEAGGFVFAVDGAKIQVLTLASNTSALMVATAGSLPQGGSAGKRPTIAAVWRDRLVLAAPPDQQQLFFMSRVGVYTDFDYSQLNNGDPASAFAGNASTAGHIGEPITALIPFSDDVLFIGGDHNLWVVRGDPADGGSIDIVSDSIGIVGQNAWAKSPDGTLYFVGTGGFYKILPGSIQPQNISSGSWNEIFRTINRASQYVNVAWDRDQQGAYVFITNVNPGGTSTHLWYDLRTGGGFWPIQYPDTQGPISALVYDGDGPVDRALFLGGRDGFVRQSQLTDVGSDDGTAISSYVTIGPVKAEDTSETLLEWLDIVLADGTAFSSATFNCQLDIFSASTVEMALTSPTYFRRKTFTKTGRQSRWLTRLRGNSFFFKLSNTTLSKTWGFEKITGLFTPAGTVRRR